MDQEITPELLEFYRREALRYAGRSTQISEEDADFFLKAAETQPLRPLYDTNPQVLPENGETPEGQLPASAEPALNQDNYRRYLRSHPGRGILRIQTRSVGGVFPIPDATVEVSLLLEGEKRVLHKGTTDSSGVLGSLILPALPADYSRTALSAPNSGSDYLVEVYHPAFLPINPQAITIFDRVETVLPVALQPKTSENGVK